MNADVQIRDQLARELADSSAPPLGALVADAVVTGSRLRVRRRLAVVTTSVAGVVALLSAGVFFASNVNGSSSSAPLLPAGPKSPVPSSPVGHKATSGEAVIALLTDLLPPGGQISEVDFYSENGNVSGGFVYDDGHGAATVSAGVSDKPADYGTEVTGMQCPADGGGFVCQYSLTPDGVEVRVITMGPYDCTDLKCSIKDLRVEIKRHDGTYVTMEAYNGPFGLGRAATRADTLLNVDQLLTMANDPRWGLTMDASFVDNAKQTVHLSRKK